MLARVWSNRNSYTAGRNKQAQDKKIALVNKLALSNIVNTA